MLELKKYQIDTLDLLRNYFQAVDQLKDVDLAFYQIARTQYRKVEQVPEPPYICLRVPTGGGKTLMACHSISIATQTLLRQERSVVLWLVPTNTIKDQTLSALRDRNHPYRQALDATLDARVRAIDVDEALHIQRSVLEGETIIIVSTLAAPRIGDTDKRKLYEQNGDLMAHFSGYPDAAFAKLEKYEGTDKPIPSLANVLCLRKPIIIMDEAHNARTPLSFDTLARFDPSCIIEFTATPAIEPPNPSNVLHSVTAWELKAEDMIKLPIRLETHEDWRQTILSAKNKRDELEAFAKEEEKGEGRYLRPIILLQAQKRNEELTVDVIYECLKEDLSIPKDQIAIETGEHSDLDGVNIFSPDCPVRYIITVDKLREGWDCSFAYILCSVRDISSRTAVEQVLGRVLRMPNAKKKNHPDLNRAYAFVTSGKFANTAQTLEAFTGALESNGFTRFDAQQSLQTAIPMGAIGLGGLFKPEGAPPTPSERGERFLVPELALWEDDELEPVEKSHFLQYGWDLTKCDASLNEEEFPSLAASSQQYDVDVNQIGRIETRFVSELQEHLAMLVRSEIIDIDQLVVWLDNHIPHQDITQPQSLLFLRRSVEYLINDRKITLDELSRDRLRLRDAVAAKIDKYREDALQKGYEQVLFGVDADNIQVSPERVFTYDPDSYPANSPYDGGISFTKHYYPVIGQMNGEEARCAQYIDSLPKVKYWVRNIERQHELSFWLPTSSDNFYPDLMVMLEDGRIMAVEYKGAHLMNEDTDEKVKLGNLWAARSEGKCLFLLVGKDDYEAQLKAVG